VTIPRVAETFKSIIGDMTYGIDFKVANLLHAEIANLTNEDLNTCIDEPETRLNIFLVSNHTLTSRAKPSSNGQLSHCSRRFGISDVSHRYMTKNSVYWRNAKNARIGLKLQVTAMPGFHSLYDWCFQTMWLFSGAPEDPEDETVVERHSSKALYSTVKSVMHAIRTEDNNDQQDVAHRMMQIGKPWTIRRWSELKLANGKPPVQIPMEDAYLVDLKWTKAGQAQLETLVESYTSEGASGMWRVHRWQLSCFSLVLGDTKDWNDVSGQWSDEWPLNTRVNTPIF